MSLTSERWRFQSAMLLAIAAAALQIFVLPYLPRARCPQRTTSSILHNGAGSLSRLALVIPARVRW